MPYKQAKSPFWWASYTDAGGARVRRSTGTKSLVEAKALESKWKLEAHQQKFWDAAPAYTFDALMVRFLKDTRKRPSHERDKFSVRRLRQHFGGMELAEITADDIAAYKQKRGELVAESTISKELGLFSSAINHAREQWEWRLENFIARKIPRQGENKTRWLTEDEATRLLHHAERNKRAPWLAHFIRLALQTGMRSGELLGLEWSRVNLEQRAIYLDPEHQKKRRSGSIPLNDASIACLQALQALKSAHKRWVFARMGHRIKSVKKAFWAATRDAGIEDCSPHTLRHTCAAWLVQSGVPIRTVAELLRHEDIRTTMRYAHLAPDSTREAVAALQRYDEKLTKPGQSMTNPVHSRQTDIP